MKVSVARAGATTRKKKGGEARKGRHSLAHGESRGERWRAYRTEPRQGRHSPKGTAYVAPVGLLNRRPLVPSALALG